MESRNEKNAVQLVSDGDQEKFRNALLKDFRKLLQVKPSTIQKLWLKSHEVQRLLKISPGTLKHLRDTGVIKFSKVWGLYFILLMRYRGFLPKINKYNFLKMP